MTSKLTNKIILTSVILFLTTAVAFSQSIIGIVDVQSYSNFFVSIGSLIPLVTFLTKILYELVPKITGSWKQICAWVIGIGLAFAGKYLLLGMFGDLTIVETITYGLLVGLGANGFYDIPVVKKFISFFQTNKNK
jgi:hypothetical protein